jgi:hypothetical protein
VNGEQSDNESRHCLPISAFHVKLKILKLHPRVYKNELQCKLYCKIGNYEDRVSGVNRG